MAVCSGCSSVGACTCTLTVVDTVSLDLTLTGTGSAGDPWVLSGEAAGGSSACAQTKISYTVSTSGSFISGLFGANVGTPEPFLSCADFIGDGVNDDVAIQAAIDAAAGASVPSPVDPALPVEVFLLPGVYLLTATITITGVGVILSGSYASGSGTGFAFGFGTNLSSFTSGFRVFENIGSALDNPARLTLFKDFTFVNFLSDQGAAFLRHISGAIEMENVTIAAGGHGADNGVIDYVVTPISAVNYVGPLRFVRCAIATSTSASRLIYHISRSFNNLGLLEDCIFQTGQVYLESIGSYAIINNTFTGNSGQPFVDGLVVVSGVNGGTQYMAVSGNILHGRGINFTNDILYSTINDNIFNADEQNIDPPAGADDWVIRIGSGCIQISVTDNIVRGAQRSGIILDGALECSILGNIVRDYNQENNIAGFVGILLRGSSLNNTVQTNTVFTSTNNSRGIQMLAGSNTNMVTNNNTRLTCAGCTSFSDAGTGNVAVAGNNV